MAVRIAIGEAINRINGRSGRSIVPISSVIEVEGIIVCKSEGCQGGDVGRYGGPGPHA